MIMSTTAPAITVRNGVSPPLWSALGAGAPSVAGAEGGVAGEVVDGEVDSKVDGKVAGLVAGAGVSVKPDSPVTGWPSLLTTRNATR